MDIPNDLNKLLARLQQVSGIANRMSGDRTSGSRPTFAEIDSFLSRHAIHSDAVIEPVEISDGGVFEFYMLAIWDRCSNDLSLLAMAAEREQSGF